MPSNKAVSACLPIKASNEELLYRKTANIMREFARCTGGQCGKSLQNIDPTQNNIHPVLGVLVCSDCHKFYKSGKFILDIDGKYMHCCWCGDGGELYCCATKECTTSICKKCINLNYLPNDLVKIKKTPKWLCLICDSKPIWHLRAFAAKLMDDGENSSKTSLVITEASDSYSITDDDECNGCLRRQSKKFKIVPDNEEEREDDLFLGVPGKAKQSFQFYNSIEEDLKNDPNLSHKTTREKMFKMIVEAEKKDYEDTVRRLEINSEKLNLINKKIQELQKEKNETEIVNEQLSNKKNEIDAIKNRMVQITTDLENFIGVVEQKTKLKAEPAAEPAKNEVEQQQDIPPVKSKIENNCEPSIFIRQRRGNKLNKACLSCTASQPDF